MKKTISILLPASLVADSSDMQSKTQKIGQVGRALALFKIQKVCVYNDDEPKVHNQKHETELMTTLLQYMETPQYLRKFLFTHSSLLHYAGILPPLRTPHHPLEDKKATVGSFREGVVVESGDKSVIEIGLRKKALVDKKLEVGTRVTLELTEVSDEGVSAEIVDQSKITEYWGYRVLKAKSLIGGLNVIKADYRLGTSRFGNPLYAVIKDIKDSEGSLAVAFGGPYSGLPEICKRQGIDCEKAFDAMVNTIPDQGTATVRAEEALLATLALLNSLLRE